MNEIWYKFMPSCKSESEVSESLEQIVYHGTWISIRNQMMTLS